MSPPIKAMILAAGRGERMRPLTDDCPKPLLRVAGKALIDWHVDALARGGVRELVVNTAWLGEKISNHLGLLRNTDGREQLSFSYSNEGDDFGYALETAGGIARALPLLGDVFWLLASDVFVPGFEFSPEAADRFIASGKLAHLWLVPNPAHNPRGDFGLSPEGLALDDAPQRLTFSTIGLYRAALFAPPYTEIAAGNPQGIRAALAPLLRAAMKKGLVSAERYPGPWTDVGTPERLAALNRTVPDEPTATP